MVAVSVPRPPFEGRHDRYVQEPAWPVSNVSLVLGTSSVLVCVEVECCNRISRGRGTVVVMGEGNLAWRILYGGLQSVGLVGVHFTLSAENVEFIVGRKEGRYVIAAS